MCGGLGRRSGAVGTAGSSSASAPNTGDGFTLSLVGVGGEVGFVVVVRRRLDVLGFVVVFLFCLVVVVGGDAGGDGSGAAGAAGTGAAATEA